MGFFDMPASDSKAQTRLLLFVLFPYDPVTTTITHVRERRGRPFYPIQERNQMLTTQRDIVGHPNTWHFRT